MGTEHWLITPSLRQAIHFGKACHVLTWPGPDPGPNGERGQFSINPDFADHPVADGLGRWLAEHQRADTFMGDDLDGWTQRYFFLDPAGLSGPEYFTPWPGWAVTVWYHGFWQAYLGPTDQPPHDPPEVDDRFMTGI